MSENLVPATCVHPKVRPAVIDQTLGVECVDCGEMLAVCWDDHVPESLWNRACANDPNAKPCGQGRDDHCGICGERFDLDPQSGARAVPWSTRTP